MSTEPESQFNSQLDLESIHINPISIKPINILKSFWESEIEISNIINGKLIDKNRSISNSISLNNSIKSNSNKINDRNYNIRRNSIESNINSTLIVNSIKLNSRSEPSSIPVLPLSPVPPLPKSLPPRISRFKSNNSINIEINNELENVSNNNPNQYRNWSQSKSQSQSLSLVVPNSIESPSIQFQINSKQFNNNCFPLNNNFIRPNAVNSIVIQPSLSIGISNSIESPPIQSQFNNNIDLLNTTNSILIKPIPVPPLTPSYKAALLNINQYNNKYSDSNILSDNCYKSNNPINRISIIRRASLPELNNKLVIKTAPSVLVNKSESYYNNLELIELLSIPLGLKYFHEFLQSEFSSENINYWLEINEFNKFIKSAKDYNQILYYSNNIITKYIKRNSEYEINISDINRESILNSYNQLNINKLIQSFNNSQNEILVLMKSDSFRRFKNNSLLWEKLLKKLIK